MPTEGKSDFEYFDESSRFLQTILIPSLYITHSAYYNSDSDRDNMARGPRPEHDEITPQTPGLDQVELKRALRMIDLRLLTVLTFLYLLAFIDRGNIGNARIAGMNDDLNLSQTQYNIALTVSSTHLFIV